MNDKIFAMGCATLIVIGFAVLSYFKTGPIDPEVGETGRMAISGLFGAAVGLAIKRKEKPPANS